MDRWLKFVDSRDWIGNIFVKLFLIQTEETAFNPAKNINALKIRVSKMNYRIIPFLSHKISANVGLCDFDLSRISSNKPC